MVQSTSKTSSRVEVVEVKVRFCLLFIFYTDLCAKGKKWGLTSTTSTLSHFFSCQKSGMTLPPGWVLSPIFFHLARPTQANEKRVSNAVSCSCMEVVYV